MIDVRRRWRSGSAAMALAGVFLLALMGGSASAMFTQVERVLAAKMSTSSSAAVTATCPAGKRVVGGGANLTPQVGDVAVDAIRPNAALTRVTARAREDETGKSDDWGIGAYAICAPPPPGLERVAATSASSSSASRSIAAECPPGKRLLGLGGEIAGNDGQVLLDGLLPNAALTRSVVNALEDETGKAGPWTLMAYAICSDPVTGLERELSTSVVDSAAFHSASADCPDGKALLSAAGTIDSPNGQVLIDGITPDIVQVTIQAVEDDTGNDQDWGATAYAVCAASVEHVSSTTARTVTEAALTASVCPLGRDGTGIGGEITGGVGQAWLRGLYIGDLGTDFMNALGGADETGVSSPFAVSSHGLCATAIPGKQLVEAEGVSNSTAAKTAVAACPEGLNVLGAGARTSENRQVTVDAMRPDANLTFVTASAREDGTGFTGNWSVTAYAICAPAPPGLQLVQSNGPLGSGEIADTTAVCPAGKHLIGTGAEIVGGFGRVGFDDIVPDPGLTSTTVLGSEDEVGWGGDWRPVAYSVCIDR